MAKRSFKTQGIEEDDSKTEQESELEEEGTESEDEDEDEVEQREERRVMIRVVPREIFERRSLIQYLHSASCSAGGVNLLCCQVDECGANLKDAKQYHRRHKVCELHAKAAFVLVKGIRQRFCQQCSRFHEIAEFDGTKRSCRDRLAGHNERRRKVQSDQRAVDVIKRSPSIVKMKAVRHPKHRELTLQGCSNTKHFRIR
ncbi:hypothetical protein CRYUN_Cryun22dG0125900 [Craigia yunnanensis]